MTVCVVVRVFDGMVFAADSASSITFNGGRNPDGTPKIDNVYRHGNKVFNLIKGLPICATTCGIGNFGPASISSIAKDLRLEMTGEDEFAVDPRHYSVEEVVVKAKKYIFDKRFADLSVKPPGQFQFWIGGYPSRMSSGYELWNVSIDDGRCDIAKMASAEEGEFGFNAGGCPEPINRLVVGFDGELIDELRKVIHLSDPNDAAAGDAEWSRLVWHLRSRTERVLCPPVMPIQDAIDFADFLVDTTKRYYRFLPGADVVGGDTDIATVTRHEGFKWIRRKHYYPPHLNPLEDGHVR